MGMFTTKRAERSDTASTGVPATRTPATSDDTFDDIDIDIDDDMDDDIDDAAFAAAIEKGRAASPRRVTVAA